MVSLSKKDDGTGGTMGRWDDAADKTMGLRKKISIVPFSHCLIVKKKRPRMAPYYKKFLLGIRHRARLTYHGNLYLAGIGHLVLNLLGYIVR